MTDPYLGEIRAVGFNFAPLGWALCHGQLMPIAQNTALFSLLGTSYGGDGRVTFGLPDLRGRFPVHAGDAINTGLSSYAPGEMAGSDEVTLVQAEMPMHTHSAGAVAGNGTANSPAGAVWAQPHQGRVAEKVYADTGQTALMSTTAVTPSGGGQPHNNLPPFTVMNFVIALQGIFPQRP